MSINLRNQIAYWILLLAGIVLLSIQIKKYYDGVLVLSLNEIIVTTVAISLTLNPKFLLDGINRILIAKYNINKNDREVDDK